MALSEGTQAPRRRILLLTPRWPYPVIGGDRLRIWHLAKAAARHHDVTLLSLCQTPAELSAELPDDGVFTSAHRVLLPKWRSWLQMLAAVGSAEPLQVAYYRSREFGLAVDRLAKDHDLVCCHLVRMAPYAMASARPRWLEMTDAISMTMERASRHARGGAVLTGPILRMEASRMREFERSMAPSFDLVTLISGVDRDSVFAGTTVPPERVIVAANGVEAPTDMLPPAGQRPPGIALIGRMDSMANRDALWFFVREILPRVLEQSPRARLHVIGHVSPRDARRLETMPGVHVEGVVEDLSSVLRLCRVGVCPVRFGAGMQNKLLDYMSHGLATVTSTVGLEGLIATPGHDLVVARSHDEWVTHIHRLLVDDEQASRLGCAGRELVNTAYRWEACLAPAIDAMAGLLGTGERGRATPPPEGDR
ncbi:glycosyltransferase family 4 protein [Ideonella sp. DXS29W]|uniref:Glycosyltransferase family 4 protein n=1 Tax=Ideonella lacteola TaxID=2984193 RepID=A0ABU9BPE7_9BURK